jgi:ABC-type multidrug transport system fused ATPase/permease subunit
LIATDDLPCMQVLTTARLAIIPQDPTLHKGSISHNLDPFGRHSAAALETALQAIRLPPSWLHAEVEAAGSNLSSGERQVLVTDCY